MSIEKLFIPKKINVGFQLREGTYTGKLAYIIYWDDKGKLRKETSWESWRHKPGTSINISENGKWTEKILGDEVKPLEFDNIPTEGFVLNKGVGGNRESWGWNVRNEYIRVYDPRGFEFEISVANLLYILQECTSVKGKGLDGEFVYSWDGKELLLLPVGTYEYRQSTGYTELQSKKVTKNDIVEGGTYLNKNNETVIYLGKFDWYDRGSEKINGGYRWEKKYHLTNQKAHIFYNASNKYNPFEKHSGFTRLGSVISTDCVSNYAELTDSYLKTQNASLLTSLKLSPDKLKYKEYPDGSIYFDNYYGYINKINQFVMVEINQERKYDKKLDETIIVGYRISERYTCTLKNGEIHIDYFKDGKYNKYNNKQPLKTLEEIKELDFRELILVTENGGEISYRDYDLKIDNYYI